MIQNATVKMSEQMQRYVKLRQASTNNNCDRQERSSELHHLQELWSDNEQRANLRKRLTSLDKSKVRAVASKFYDRMV